MRRQGRGGGWISLSSMYTICMRMHRLFQYSLRLWKNMLLPKQRQESLGCTCQRITTTSRRTQRGIQSVTFECIFQVYLNHLCNNGYENAGSISHIIAFFMRTFRWSIPVEHFRTQYQDRLSNIWLELRISEIFYRPISEHSIVSIEYTRSKLHRSFLHMNKEISRLENNFENRPSYLYEILGFS